MINHTTEELIPIEEAGSLIPGNPSRCTVYRWTLKGSRGQVLETIVCGHKRFTSREAIDRFITAQNADKTPAPAITASQRRRQSEAARQELSKAGV